MREYPSSLSLLRDSAAHWGELSVFFTVLNSAAESEYEDILKQSILERRYSYMQHLNQVLSITREQAQEECYAAIRTALGSVTQGEKVVES